MKRNSPTPIDNEIFITPNKVIMSKTNYKGIIEYANDYFKEVCGYSQEELIGKPHNIIRHPDMPKVVFKIMWEKLHKGENLYAVVKNLTKDGSFYWVVTKFETTFNEDGSILSHYARRKAVPLKIKETAEAIYKTILQIEKHDEKLAEEYFYEILDKYGLTYDDFFLEVAEMTAQEVADYFHDSKQNINTSHEDIVLEVENSLKVKHNKLLESLRQMDSDKLHNNKTEEQNYATPNKRVTKGFLGNLSELEDLKSVLKSKNSL